MIVNFGVDLYLTPAPEPLLAPTEGTQWEVLWSSEDPRYGGSGTPPIHNWHDWRILGHSTIVLIPSRPEK
jgi:maltooligosyltrehalose trehalohydrolase